MAHRIRLQNSAFVLLLMTSFFAVAQHADPDTFKESYLIQQPWLTGPLLAPAGVTIPKGHTNIEPYLFLIDTNGVYTHDWHTRSISAIQTINPILILSQGLANRLDAQITVPYSVDYRNDQSYSGWGDINLLLGIQAIRSDTWPNLRITIGEIFPVGRYNHLSNTRLGTDAIGAGSYQTNLIANFQKAFRIFEGRVLRTRLSLGYIIPTAVNLQGLNTYGGGIGTNGTLKVGNKFNGIFGLEYTLTQKWVPALDIQYNYNAASTFSGIPGTTKTGEALNGNVGSAASISLAPAIEYNFNSSLGIIGGAWFTVAGRNSSEFTSAILAINYYR